MVNKKDKLFVLGDVAWKQKHLKQLDEINCYKEMIYGNHDQLHAREYLKHFNKLHGFRRYKNFWLSHCPIHPQEVYRCMGNIHGHIHANAGTKELYKPYYCVNLDFHNFHPVNFETIKDIFSGYCNEQRADLLKERLSKFQESQLKILENEGVFW